MKILHKELVDFTWNNSSSFGEAMKGEVWFNEKWDKKKEKEDSKK